MGRKSTTERTVTMTDIAGGCGLSHATVSYVLRNKLNKPVSPATRERVFAEAVRLGYVPQRHHRIDAAKLTVLFICPEYHVAYGEASYPGRVMANLARLSAESHIHFHLTATERQTMNETLFRGICAEQADAVVLTRMTKDEIAAIKAICPVPVLHLGPPCDGIVPTVSLDDTAIGRQAAEHLWELGHRHTLVLSVPGGDQNQGRTAGFRHVWQERSEGRLEPLVWEGTYLSPSGLKHADRYLSLEDPKPTAIFAHSDTIAYGFMQRLHEVGKQIPDHVSILGCDDIPFSEYASPGLSSFGLREAETAEHLLQLVRHLCLGEPIEKLHILMTPKLIVRKSVRALPS